jgi:dual specificity protein kinase YAK1
MSEPELAYMTEDFDLPRWQTQSHLDPLSSSSTQAAQHTAAPYLYPPPPPPQSQSLTGQQQRLHPIQQSSTNQGQSSRQPTRISQLLEQEQQQQGFAGSPPYSVSGHTQLNRSASLGGGANSGTTSSTRSRRHHQPDDLEGAFNSDTQRLPSPRQTGLSQLQTSLYPSSVAYHQPPSLSGANPGQSPSAASPAAGETYSDMYYNGSGGRHAPKRSQTENETNSALRGGGRSPMRTTGGNTTNSSILDSYAQQSQYSPTTASYPSPYAPVSGSGNLPPAPYHSHSRNHSQVKGERLTPPLPSPYTPGALNSSAYSPSYGMDSSSSPHPPPPARQSSASTPNTPFPYAHPSQSPSGGQYFKQEQMQVDIPQHKRRASGFKRVRDARDLRPYINQQPSGRRMDSTGTYLSVRCP